MFLGSIWRAIKIKNKKFPQLSLHRQLGETPENGYDEYIIPPGGTYMGRQKNRLIIPKNVARIMDIITLLLDCHPAGYLVLCGQAESPDYEEIAEMLRNRNGCSEHVHVQNGSDVPFAQLRAEAIDAAKHYISDFEHHGGFKALAGAIRYLQRCDPQRCELLRRIGMSGMPGAKSLEALAGEYHMDIKTLYSYKQNTIKDVAYIFMFGGDNFELAG